MLFNGRTLIFTFSRIQVRIAENERLQSFFKMSMAIAEHVVCLLAVAIGLRHQSNIGIATWPSFY